MTYDYMECLKDDIRQYLEDNGIELTEDNYDEVYDDMFVSDSVTGNGSGSYFFSRYKAEEALCHNWVYIEDMLNDGFIEDLGRLLTEKGGAEAIDVSVRCYLLGDALTQVMEER